MAFCIACFIRDTAGAMGLHQAEVVQYGAFVLLALIGGNMIHEALDNDEEEADASLDVKTMFLLAVATSIDALAIGITFAFLKVNIIPAVCFIGIVTFIYFLCRSKDW